MNTEEVLKHHLTAFGNNDIDGIMLDYTAQSVILCDKGEVKGLANIREFLVELFGLIPAGCQFEMKHLIITNRAAQIIWSSKSSAADISFGTDTFIIEHGKIMIHTVATIISKP